jgi:hypothetical protein
LDAEKRASLGRRQLGRGMFFFSGWILLDEKEWTGEEDNREMNVFYGWIILDEKE